MRTYSELIRIDSWSDRLEYLKLLDGNVRSPRKISMKFYKSRAWIEVMEYVRERDRLLDLAFDGMYITTRPIVHHMNPITDYDIENLTKITLDPEYLILTHEITHNLIHYGKSNRVYIERMAGDTNLW